MFIVCPNGMGHFKRVMAVVGEILKLTKLLQITIVCQSWQRSKIDKHFSVPVRFFEDLMEPGVSYEFFEDTFFEQKKYLKWEESVAKLEAFKNADLIVSDNLCGILEHHDRVILMSSFLWMDLLQADDRFRCVSQEFVEREKQLLSSRHPKMLCVEDIVMPAVRNYTEAVPLPWFAESLMTDRADYTEEPTVVTIAVLLGRTGVMDPWLKAFVSVAKEEGIVVKLPSPYDKEYNTESFSFSDDAFQAVDMVLCRPGIGVITDCIRNQTVMLTLFEDNNTEMEHNAKAIAEVLQLESLGVDPCVYKACEAVRNLSKDYIQLNRMQKRLRTRQLGGTQKAADYILKSLE